MIPMRTSSVFKSRWMALLWAAGIIWFAYDTATSQLETDNLSNNAEQAVDAAGSPVTSDDQNRLADAINSF